MNSNFSNNINRGKSTPKRSQNRKCKRTHATSRNEAEDLVRLRLVPQTQVLTLRQHTLNTPLMSSTTGVTSGQVVFGASAFDQFNDFAAVFDQWRISEIQFQFTPRVNVVADNSFINTANSGELLTVFDYDGNFPTTAVQALDYDSCVVVPGYMGVTRRTIPSILVTAFNGSSSNAVVPAYNQWIATGGTTTKYYSLCWVWTAATNTGFAFDLHVTAILQFRYVR